MNKKHKNCKYQHKGFLPGTTARKHVSENPAKMGLLYWGRRRVHNRNPVVLLKQKYPYWTNLELICYK